MPEIHYRDSESEKPTLEDAQRLVDGYVEMIHLRNGDQMLVDEEGLMHCRPENPEASMIAGKRIVGDVIVLTKAARWE